MLAVVWLSLGTLVLLVAVVFLILGLHKIEDIWHRSRDVGTRMLVGSLLLFVISAFMLFGSDFLREFLK